MSTAPAARGHRSSLHRAAFLFALALAAFATTAWPFDVDLTVIFSGPYLPYDPYRPGDPEPLVTLAKPGDVLVYKVHTRTILSGSPAYFTDMTFTIPEGMTYVGGLPVSGGTVLFHQAYECGTSGNVSFRVKPAKQLKVREIVLAVHVKGYDGSQTHTSDGRSAPLPVQGGGPPSLAVNLSAQTTTPGEVRRGQPILYSLDATASDAARTIELTMSVPPGTGLVVGSIIGGGVHTGGAEAEPGVLQGGSIKWSVMGGAATLQGAFTARALRKGKGAIRATARGQATFAPPPKNASAHDTASVTTRLVLYPCKLAIDDGAGTPMYEAAVGRQLRCALSDWDPEAGNVRVALDGGALGDAPPDAPWTTWFTLEPFPDRKLTRWVDARQGDDDRRTSVRGIVAGEFVVVTGKVAIGDPATGKGRFVKKGQPWAEGEILPSARTVAPAVAVVDLPRLDVPPDGLALCTVLPGHGLYDGSSPLTLLHVPGNSVTVFGLAAAKKLVVGRADGRSVSLPTRRANVASFNNRGQQGVAEILPDHAPGGALDLMYHCSHDLTFTGDVLLQNNLIYVEGDVHFQGGVSGVGVVAAEGDITIDGPVAVATAPGVLGGFVAGGTISLRPPGK
jgi:hypothetical protein